MPLKKDAAGKRWVEMELLLPGTPEQVWQAMATGPGNAAWFTRGEIEERVGGAFGLDFGQGALSKGTVTAWEPPRHFGYVEIGWDEAAPPVATEITITARSGDQCVVRMVHSLFASTDDWDDQLEGFEGGWPSFFAVLRVYMAGFAGEPAASFMAVTTTRAPQGETWKRAMATYGLVGADVGDRRTVTAGPETWPCLVEEVHQVAKQRFMVLRLDDGCVVLGTYDSGAGTNVSISRYYYGNDASARAAAGEPALREWLAATYGER